MSLIVNFLTSPQAADFVQNSTCQVLSEGCLKAVGRPTFTLLDKTATKEQRKYSATKELLYQSFSMAAFFALIFPIKKNTFRLLKFFPQLKDCDVINAKTIKEYQEKLKQVTDKKMLTKIKGANELMSIIASGIILAVITPQIVTRLVHPIMNKLSDDGQKNKLDKKA